MTNVSFDRLNEIGDLAIKCKDSPFELEVLNDIIAWYYTQPKRFESMQNVINAFWNEKLG